MSVPDCRCGFCLHGPLNRRHCLACMKRKTLQEKRERIRAPTPALRATPTNSRANIPSNAGKNKATHDYHSWLRENGHDYEAFKAPMKEKSLNTRLFPNDLARSDRLEESVSRDRNSPHVCGASIQQAQDRTQSRRVTYSTTPSYPILMREWRLHA